MSRSKSTFNVLESKRKEVTFLHLPPILTVDQLSAFRKKRSPVTLPKDNLSPASGTFKQIKSEYRRRYKKIEDYLPQLNTYTKQSNPPLFDLDDKQDFLTEYGEAYQFDVKDKEPESMIDENKHQDSSRLFQKQCSTLKLEGDFHHLTNYAEDFIKYLIEKRGALQRRETTLKMLGDLNHDTENRNNFVPYTNVARPPLCKRFTNLHLSGSLHMETESRDKFLPYKVDRQHQLAKLPTNLHLEGTLFLEPEYRSAFVEYQNYEKPKPVKPQHHLRSPIDFSDESSSGRMAKHPVIPFLRTYSPPIDNLLHENRISSRPVSRASSRPPSRTNFQSSSSRPLSRSQSRAPSRASSSRPVSRSPSKSPARFTSRPPSRACSSDNRNNEKELDMNRLKVSGSKPDDRKSSTPRSQEVKIQIPSRPSSLFGTQQASAKRHFTTTLAPNMAYQVFYDNDMAKSSRSKWNANEEQYYINKPLAPEDFDGRFECQPEYRKAYLNYLIRERIENQPQLIKRPTNKFVDSESLSDTSALRIPHKTFIRKFDKLESKAFGPKCASPHKDSFSGTTSSEDYTQIQMKKSKIPRSKSFRVKSPAIAVTGGTMDQTTSDDCSSSEPAFVVM